MSSLQYELYTYQHAFEMKTQSQFPTFLMEMLQAEIISYVFLF